MRISARAVGAHDVDRRRLVEIELHRGNIPDAGPAGHRRRNPAPGRSALERTRPGSPAARAAMARARARRGHARGRRCARGRRPASGWWRAASRSPRGSRVARLAARGSRTAGATCCAHCAAGPCVRALHTAAPPEGTWGCARPVHLLTAIDHLQLAPGASRDRRGRVGPARRRHQPASRGQRIPPARSPARAATGSSSARQPLECTSVEPDDAVGPQPARPDARRTRRCACPVARERDPDAAARASGERGARRRAAAGDQLASGCGASAALEKVVRRRACRRSTRTMRGSQASGACTARLRRSLGEFAAAGEAADGHAGRPVQARRAATRRTALAFAEATCFAPAQARLRAAARRAMDFDVARRPDGHGGPPRPISFLARRRPLSEALA